MENTNINHIVKIIERKNITISAVKKLISFNDKEFIIDTAMGTILIKGTDLELIKLDTIEGNLSIKGTIDSFSYGNVSVNKETFVTKLFK